MNPNPANLGNASVDKPDAQAKECGTAYYEPDAQAKVFPSLARQACRLRWVLCVVIGAVLLGASAGCTPTVPATKVPSATDSAPKKDPEELPTPPKRDPG